MVTEVLLRQIKIVCFIVHFLLFTFDSKGWSENSFGTDDMVANTKICSADEKESSTALQKIHNPKKYFLKYKHWGSPEKKIWKEICQGNEVNLSLQQDQSGQSAMCEENQRQTVNPLFVNTLLLDPALKKHISHKGVRIKCAKFQEALDLSRISIEFPLEISESTFNKKVDLSWLKSDSNIIFEHSTFYEGIDFNNIETKSDLKLERSLIFESAESEKSKEKNISGLFGAKIGDELHLEGVFFAGCLDMRKAQVAKGIYADLAVFNNKVFMEDVKVGGSVEFTNVNKERNKSVSQGAGELILTNINVGYSLSLTGSLLNKADLVNAEIGNDLILDSSEFFGLLNMEKIRANGDLSLKGIVFNAGKGVNLKNSKINNNLDFSGSRNLSSINLASATISGDLILPALPEKCDPAKEPSVWKSDAVLNLRDLEISNLIETKDSWPEHLDLFGFRYKRLYKNSKGDLSNFHERDDLWIKKWFKKGGEKINDEQKSCELKGKKKDSCEQQEFSLQPYFQMASVLEESGFKDKANKIRLLGKQEERSHASVASLTYWWLSFQASFIGYGYSIRRIFWAFMGLLILGWGVFVYAKRHNPDDKDISGFEFSFDLLLPIIELNKENHDKALHGFSGGYRCYFYFHKIMGHILAAYLFAGLTGLGK